MQDMILLMGYNYKYATIPPNKLQQVYRQKLRNLCIFIQQIGSSIAVADKIHKGSFDIQNELRN